MKLWPFVIFPLLSYLLPGELIYNAAKSFTARNIRNHCEYKCDAAWNKVETVFEVFLHCPLYWKTGYWTWICEHGLVLNGVDIFEEKSEQPEPLVLTFQLWRRQQMLQRRNFLRLLHSGLEPENITSLFFFHMCLSRFAKYIWMLITS